MGDQKNLSTAELMQQNLQLQKQITSLNQRNEQLSEIINSLQRMIFGQHSEKRTYVLPDANQLGFLEEIPSDTKEPEKTTETEPSVEVSAHTRKPKRMVEEMTRNLPAEERILDIADTEKIDESGKPLIPMGKSYVRTEIEVRPFVLGRKNWLFADSQDGARALAICYTILETAKANHLDIRKYLDWLLSTLPRKSENSRQDELESMLPWDPEVQFFRTRNY